MKKIQIDDCICHSKIKEHSKIKDSILLGQKVKIPFFKLKNEVVWGATSMILSEFKKILKGAV